ncbi:MAG: hypothetical protein MRZ79_06065 [Bacteroidia bacterium]|nr:hypothetical protein [Bacteroidia bacterium]
MKKIYLAILLSILMGTYVHAQSLKASTGEWLSEKNSLFNCLVIKSHEGKYRVTGYQLDMEAESRKMVFKEMAKTKDGKLYVQSDLKGKPFKAEIAASGMELKLKMIIKDPKKGMLKTQKLFSKNAPNPKALVSKAGYIQLWDCKECVAGSHSTRGKGPLPVEIFLRSKKMKKTEYGFDVPAIEMKLKFTESKGKYARYTVPALQRGDYEVFVQYKISEDEIFEPDPLPYNPAILKAQGGMPIRLTLKRKQN